MPPNLSPSSEALGFTTPKGEIWAVFGITGVYRLEGHELSFLGNSLSHDASRASVHKLLGKPQANRLRPNYGKNFSQDHYYLYSPVGLPCVELVVLYRSDVVENFSLIRVLRGFEVFLTQLF